MCVFPSTRLCSTLNADLLYCSCGGRSVFWKVCQAESSIFWWRHSHRTHTYIGYTERHFSELEIETSHSYTHTRGGLEQSVFHEIGRRDGGAGGAEKLRCSLNPLGFNDIITSQLHTSSTFSFQTGFHAKSRVLPNRRGDWIKAYETHECVRVLGCGGRHPERGCWCKTFLLRCCGDCGGVSPAPPGGEVRTVTSANSPKGCSL